MGNFRGWKLHLEVTTKTGFKSYIVNSGTGMNPDRVDPYPTVRIRFQTTLLSKRPSVTNYPLDVSGTSSAPRVVRKDPQRSLTGRKGVFP